VGVDSDDDHVAPFRERDSKDRDGQPDFRSHMPLLSHVGAGADRMGGLSASHPKGQGAMRATRSAPSHTRAADPVACGHPNKSGA
jgi:hypothetical protein